MCLTLLSFPSVVDWETDRFRLNEDNESYDEMDQKDTIDTNEIQLNSGTDSDACEWNISISFADESNLSLAITHKSRRNVQ